MLKIVEHLRALDFSAVMEVYAEGNRENGAQLYPDLPAGQQLLRAEQDFYDFLQVTFFSQLQGVYYLWEVDGKPLSCLRLEPYRDGLLLEALETHPEHRGRGYAKALIRAALDTLSHEKVYVHISRRNAASIAVHTACGFRKILDYAVYADGSVLRTSDTYLYEKK